MQKFLTILLVFIILPCFIQISFSQPPPPPPKPIPIDGSLIALIIAGFAFAAKKFYKKYDRNY